MDDYQRRIDLANYWADKIIYEKLSIREVAKEVGVSKTTVHNYITNYVTGMSRSIKLRGQLDRNIRTMHLKGGRATKRKYHLLYLKKFLEK